MKGYKVFEPGWKCRDKQYTCPGTFEEDVTPDVCKSGMHFCERLVDCFRYYVNADERYHVAEVIALGDISRGEDKCCTNKLEIVREIPWAEVVQLANMGRANTGICNFGNLNSGNCNIGDMNTGTHNSGDSNSGDLNSGNCNSGNFNSGNYNSGNYNSGNYNSGNFNSGNYNSGNYNSGDYNSGHGNFGDLNTGNCNSGNWNSGENNSGNYNSGNYNTGNGNSGNFNTGEWNKTDFSSGCFNTKESKLLMFNKPSDWTFRDWFNSKARCILSGIQKGDHKWIWSYNMTNEEKEQHPEYKITGGFLKELDEPESVQAWWDGLDEEDRDVIRGLPNFNAEIFYECTGIKDN